MSRRLMIDPPSGWKYGFPIYVDEEEGRRVLDMSLPELTDYLLEQGYPHDKVEQNAGWTRFLWVDNTND